MQEGHPITFISKTLSPKNRGLSVYDKELLAIVFAVTYWSHYLSTKPFEVRTDHKTLCHLMKQKHYPGTTQLAIKVDGFRL